MLACVTALALALTGVRAAGQGGPAPTSPAANPPGPATEGAAPQPDSEGKPVTLGEIVRDGFEIRAATFVPAEAVTRQSGKVSPDAVMVTLQKAPATAVCFYSLKAYVGRKLATIPACTVHR